ncbi:MAG: prolipoprotein diacylglyceryl transferase, partial [Anaerolineae bacterium]|nr:prolipoprotein diacylglyceryl transferase [Anaerolineae bacterium]
GLIYAAHKKHIKLLSLLDLLAPSIALGQAIGRWGNFFNQELYGLPTRLPWGITITNVNQRLSPYDDLTQYPLDTLFHPVFLYESLWHLLGFAVFIWVSRKYGTRLPAGNLFAFILVWYGIGRFFIEALRPDAWLVGGVAVAQIISVGLILIGGGLIAVRRKAVRDDI